MKTKKESNHKHTWACIGESNDIIQCEKCNIDYDLWFEKMSKKGYTIKQMERFEE